MMLTMNIFPETGLSVPGIRLSSVQAGIRYSNRKDICLVEITESGAVAAVFTRNQFCAAPVQLAKQHLGSTQPRYLLINAGNANAGTGEAGMQMARRTCEFLAEAAGCDVVQVLPFSTGVIGEDLPIEPFAQAIPELLDTLAEESWLEAATSIMTTDTQPKLCSAALDLPTGAVTLTGMAKGSGMIRPDMATMLAYIATDASVDQVLLQQMLEKAVAPSFNSITVDGDTSTNDACVLIATGASGVRVEADSAEAEQLQDAITQVCWHLAREIVLDGEGATKLVEIQVEGARNEQDARAVAYTLAHSPLAKTAWFASDPNWGRILAAVGRSGVEELRVDHIRIWLDDVCIVSQGGRDADYQERRGAAVVAKPDFVIRIDLAMGQSAAKVLTCDLSCDYVKINAEYRS